MSDMTLKQYLDSMLEGKFESGNASDHLHKAIENMKADGLDNWKISQALVLAGITNIQSEEFHAMEPFINSMKGILDSAAKIYIDGEYEGKEEA